MIANPKRGCDGGLRRSVAIGVACLDRDLGGPPGALGRHRGGAAALALIAWLAPIGAAAAPEQGGDALAKKLDASLQVLYRLTVGEQAKAERSRAATDRLLRHRREAHGEAHPLRAAPQRFQVLVDFTGDPAALSEAGFDLEGRVGRIVTGTLVTEDLPALAAVEGVHRIQASRWLAARGVTATAGGAGAVSPFPDSAADTLGTGVLVAYVDTGVDVFHLDFRDASGDTRIEYLLDLSVPGDVDGDGDLDGPGPFGGTLYGRAEIDAALDAGSPLPSIDPTGHGTHGLSIAAGDDATLPGMAPAATLLVVKATRDTDALGFLSGDVVNALSFVDDKAAELGLPYVVNLSLGSLFASHDGRSLEEQALDSLVGPGRPGKVAVAAAGNASDNAGSAFHHLAGIAHAGLATSHTLTVPAYTPGAGRGDDRILLDLWYEGNDQLSIAVTGPAACGAPVVTAAFGSFEDVATACGDVFVANLGGPDPANGDVEAIVLLDDYSGTPPAAGDWTITVTGEAISETGVYHGWLSEESRVGAAAPHLAAGADNRYLVGKPGTAYHVITVASFARHAPGSRFLTSWSDVNGIGRSDTTATDGELSGFSSPGPTRDGRRKPELAAPGERVAGAVARDALPLSCAPPVVSLYCFHPFPEPDALLIEDAADLAFGMLQGTSFAAPVVTGLVARILSTDPTLDAVEVRNVLLNAALADAFTGAVPNDLWGWGKVDLTVGGPPLPPHLRITTESLPPAVVGEAYSIVLTAAGGQLPYSWAALDPLPAGLTLDDSVLRGTPTAAGTVTFTIEVADTTPQSVQRDFTLAVAAAAPLHMETLRLPSGRLGHAYAHRLRAAGGTAPYAWSVAGGGLPPGLALAGDRIEGAPTALGSFSFTLAVQDAVAAEVRRSFRIRVGLRGGDTWSPLGQSGTVVNELAVDPNDPQHLFCSTENIFDDTQQAVFESRDGGESWRAISDNNGFGGKLVKQLAVSPATSEPWAVRDDYPETVLRYDSTASVWIDTQACGSEPSIEGFDFDAVGTAYVSGGVCVESDAFRRSLDGGVSWQTVGTLCGSDLAGSNGALAVHRAAPSTMYALHGGSGSTTATCASTNGGASWVEVDRDSTFSLGIWELAVSPSNPQDVLRSYNMLSGLDRLARTVDGGVVWAPVAPSAASPYALARSPSDPMVAYYANASALYRSANGGQSWTTLPVSFLPHEALAVDPLDANVVYLGSGRGLLRSDDGGQTWALKNRGLVRRGLVSMALSPTMPQELLLGGVDSAYLTRSGGGHWTEITGSLFFSDDLKAATISAADPDLYFLLGTFRIYRSTNRGLTWANIGNHNRALDADPFAAGIVLAGDFTDLFRSTDGGDSWDPVPGFFGGLNDYTFARDVPGRAYLAAQWLTGAETGGGIYRSADSGSTWLPIGLNSGGSGAILVEPAPSDSDYVYAVSYPGFVGAPRTIYYRDPTVGSFQAATIGPPRPTLSLAVDPTDPLTAYAGVDNLGTAGSVGGVYKTTDGGRNWTRLVGVLDAHDVVDLATHPSEPGIVYAATAVGGAWRSTDGGLTWIALDTYGTVADLVNVSRPDPTNPFLLYAGTEGYGVQASTDSGRTFVARNSGLGNPYVRALAFDPDAPATLYAGTAYGVYKTNNAGVSWVPTALGAGEVTDLVTDNEGTAKRIWITVKGQGVAFSADGGATVNLYTTGLASLDLSSIEVEDRGAAKRIWITSKGGDGVAFSDDLGQTWVSAAGNGLTDREVNDLAIDGTAKRIWITADNGVFSSDDDGLSWSDRSVGLPGRVPVTSVALDPHTGEPLVSLFSGEDGGVYRGGGLRAAWAAFNDGLGELRVRRLTHDGGRQLDPDSFETTFYAATAGDGLYASRVSFEEVPAPQITTASLPPGTPRQPYAATLAATGGIPPYAWSLDAGALPAGVALAGGGTLSGTPVLAGLSTFTVRVVDANSKVDRQELSILVAGVGVAVTPVTGLETSEAGVTDSFTVVLTGEPAANVVIDVASSDPGEGTAEPQQLTFTGGAGGTWSSPQTVTVTGVDDAVADGDRPYTVTLTMNVAATGDPVYDGIDPADVAATNADDDVAGVTVAPTSGLETSEAGGSDGFTVVLDSEPTANVVIDVATSDPGEGTVEPTQLTFTGGASGTWDSPQTVNVTGADDAVDDGDRSYTVTLTMNVAATGDPVYDGIDPADVAATNADDDVAGVTVAPTSGLETGEAGGSDGFTVMLDSEPTANVVIDVASTYPGEGTAEPTQLTFTGGASGTWGSPQTVTVTGADDAVDDGDRPYTVTLTMNVAATGDPVYDGIDPADVAATNADDDMAGVTVAPTSGLETSEAGGSDGFTVVLDSEPTANVVIDVASSDPGEGTVEPTQLTFTGGASGTWGSPQTVTVTGADDAVDDGDRSYTVTLTMNVAATGDPVYDGIDPADVAATNADDDMAGVTVAPTSGLETSEAGGSDGFTVMLDSEPVADVVIDVASTDTSEGTVTPQQLTFTGGAGGTWSSPQAVTVTGADDAIDDGNRPYTVTMTMNVAATGDPVYDGIDPVDLSATNADDDTATVIVAPTSGLVTSEAGSSAGFTVVLASEPTGSVVIDIAASDPTEGAALPSQLSFTGGPAGTWATPQLVTVTGVDDAVADGDQPYTVMVTMNAPLTLDPLYDSLDPADVAAVNRDDVPGGFFYTLTPCRLLDTRQAGQGPALQSGVPRLLLTHGACGIPATARVLSLNVTVTQPSGGGYLTLYPADIPIPGTSTVNYRAGQTRANNAVLSLATDGSGGLRAVAAVAGAGSVHLIVDVNGYFE